MPRDSCARRVCHRWRMWDLLFGLGVTALCMAVPVAFLTAYLVIARWRVKRAMRHPAGALTDISERRLDVPNTVHVWVAGLEAVRFRRLGEVQRPPRSWVSWILLAPAGTIVARASDKPYNVSFQTRFEDGAAVITSWQGSTHASLDLLMQRSRADVEKLLELQQQSVAIFAARHGLPVMIGNLAAWIESDQAIGRRFSGEMMASWNRASARRLRLAAAVSLALAVGGALAAIVSGALPPQ